MAGSGRRPEHRGPPELVSGDAGVWAPLGTLRGVLGLTAPPLSRYSSTMRPRHGNIPRSTAGPALRDCGACRGADIGGTQRGWGVGPGSCRERWGPCREGAAAGWGGEAQIPAGGSGVLRSCREGVRVQIQQCAGCPRGVAAHRPRSACASAPGWWRSSHRCRSVLWSFWGCPRTVRASSWTWGERGSSMAHGDSGAGGLHRARGDSGPTAAVSFVG